MRKIYFLLFSFLVLTNYAAQSQCTFASSFGSATINPAGAIVTISGCSFAGEYSTISGAVNGQTLQFTTSVPTDFITIHSGTFNGPVVASGITPLVFANTFTGTLYAHWAADASCNTQASCRTTTVQCTSCVLPPPSNDLCSGAINIDCGQTIAGNTSAATIDAVPTCVTTLNTAPGVWYSFVGDGQISTLSLCGSGYDTKIGVFTGTCGALVCVTGNDDFCGLQSQVSVPTTLGTTYYVLVTGFGTNSGAFTLARTCVVPPPNDLCTGAITINCGQTIAGNTSTGASADAVPTCVTTLNTAPGVWYTFAGDGSITTLSLCGSSFDTEIGVFSGSCGALVCVTGNDDFCGVQSQVTFTANVGTTYYVLVTGFGTASGAFTLARTCIFPCSGVPSPGTISGPAGTVCNPTPVTLTVSGYSTGSGISFQWNSSATSGGPYTPIAGATNNTYSFSATSTRYYTVTVTCSFSGFSANTTQFAVNVSTLALTNVVATPNTACSPAPTIVITGTATGGTVGGNTVLASSGVINLAIADLTTVTSSLVVPANSIPTFNGLKIRLNIGHSWVGDLKITLTTPCGNTIIFDRPGVPASTLGNSDNLGTTNAGSPPAPPSGVYIFDVAGATIIPEVANGTTGFIAPGTYQPSESSNPGVAHNWAGLTFPCSTAGTWTLSITDNAGGDIGNLTDWAILVPAVYTHALTGPGVITQNPPTGTNNANASFNVTGAPVGVDTYTLTTTDGAGCTTSATVNVTVNATPVITFTPPAPVICAGAIQQITAGASGNTQTYSVSGTITIPLVGTGSSTGSPANPYPSIINVAGLPTSGVTVKSITINGFTHTFPDDVDALVQSPTGTNVVVMSDVAGTSAPVSPLTYTFDDLALTSLTTGSNPSGTYKPTNSGATDNWPAPGPGSITQATPTIASFGNGNMNGAWNLYVVDDAAGDVGTMTGWSITFNIPSPVVFSPVANLFTDALATIPYTGTPVTTIWAKPPTTTTYTATATVNGCTGSGTVTVTVNQLPAITVQPAPATQTVCPGATVTYTVTATGAGLTYQWQKNGVNLVNDIQTNGVTTNTLVITNVSAANTGSYTVVVSGTCTPSVTSSAAVLNVASAPTITTQPAPVIVCAGANAVFSVVATGVPPPTIYQWQVSTDAGVTWTNLLTGGSFTPTFTITGTTTAMNNNRYRVIITNSCGQSITSSAALLTVNALPAVTVTQLSNRICISDTLIQLVGSPVGGSWSGIGVSGQYFIPSATAIGTFTLTYTYTNAAGCTATATTVAKVEDCPERIRLLRDNAIILYPNPNNGHFNIRINSTLYNYIGMKVFTSTGDLVKTISFNNLVYGRVVPIDISQFPAGVYMVKFYYDDGMGTANKTFEVIVGGH